MTEPDNTPEALRDMAAGALYALDVQAVTDPTLDAADAGPVLLGALAFRVADLSCPTGDYEPIEPHTTRACFTQGWNDLVSAGELTPNDEAEVLAVFTDLLGAVATVSSGKRSNPYAKAAASAISAAAALMFLSTDSTDADTRTGAADFADEALTHAHMWLAHHRTGGTS